MNDPEKAVAACIAYASAQAEVRRLTNEIGEALNACASAHMERYSGVDCDFGHYPLWESHLKQAYAFEVIEETQYTSGKRDYLDADEQAKILAECPYCLAAHNAIQRRKVARKAFAAAKRYVGGIGRRVIAKKSQGEA